MERDGTLPGIDDARIIYRQMQMLTKSRACSSVVERLVRQNLVVVDGKTNSSFSPLCIEQHLLAGGLGFDPLPVHSFSPIDSDLDGRKYAPNASKLGH